MTSEAVVHISSRDNALVKSFKRLAQDNTAYRKQGQVWLEGDHLCRALLARGQRARTAVFAESFWPVAQAEWAHPATRSIVLADALFKDVSGLESPAQMAYVMDLPAVPAVQPGVASVILDRVQDAGNVGSILRSAAAFGFKQLIALKGTAALWSPKVLRAGMGAHFGLHLIEGVDLGDLDGLAVPLLATSSHEGDLLQKAELPMPCAWVLGHEGTGVSAALMARASRFVRIGQPGGEESLNVAAAAAICLHASSVRQ